MRLYSPNSLMIIMFRLPSRVRILAAPLERLGRHVVSATVEILDVSTLGPPTHLAFGAQDEILQP